MALLQPINISNKIFDEINILIRKSWPNACILWVDEVVNEELYDKYKKYKEDIVSKERDVKELQVFHGTKQCYIHSIINNGFNVRENVRSAFGKGTYCGIKANYSINYSDTNINDISYIFICNIIVGKYCVGKKNTVINTSLYDCAVNNLTNPTIFSLPNNNSIFPKFIVAFHKNAKM